MTQQPKTKTDYFFAFLGIAISSFTIPAILAGIWVDARWWLTALLLMLIGAVCFAISHYLDQKWAREGRTK